MHVAASLSDAQVKACVKALENVWFQHNNSTGRAWEYRSITTHADDAECTVSCVRRGDGAWAITTTASKPKTKWEYSNVYQALAYGLQRHALRVFAANRGGNVEASKGTSVNNKAA